MKESRLFRHGVHLPADGVVDGAHDVFPFVEGAHPVGLARGDHPGNAGLDHLRPAGEARHPVGGDVPQGHHVVEFEQQLVDPHFRAVFRGPQVRQAVYVVGVMLVDPDPLQEVLSYLGLHFGARHGPVGSEGDENRRVLQGYPARSQFLENQGEQLGRGGVPGVVIDQDKGRIALFHHLPQSRRSNGFSEGPLHFVQVVPGGKGSRPGSEHRQEIAVGNDRVSESFIGESDPCHGFTSSVYLCFFGGSEAEFRGEVLQHPEGGIVQGHSRLEGLLPAEGLLFTVDVHPLVPLGRSG